MKGSHWLASRWNDLRLNIAIILPNRNFTSFLWVKHLGRANGKQSKGVTRTGLRNSIILHYFTEASTSRINRNRVLIREEGFQGTLFKFWNVVFRILYDKLVLHSSTIFSSKIFDFMSWVASISKLHRKLNYFDENVSLLRYCTYSIKIGTLPLSKKGKTVVDQF